MSKHNTFINFGKNFQLKILSSLIINKTFLMDIVDIIQEQYFQTQSLKRILRMIKQYYKQFNKGISLDVITVKIKQIDNPIIKTTVIEDIRMVLKYTKSDDLDYIQKESKTFCLNQRLAKALLKSIDHLKLGDYQMIRSQIQEALKCNISNDLGDNYFDNIQQRYNFLSRNGILTPWDKINEITDGGIGKGQLGVVIASSGTGKSWLLTLLGKQALKKGLNVVHYTLQLSKQAIQKRYDCMITEMPINTLKNKVQDIKNHLASVRQNYGKIIVKQFPPDTITPSQLKAHLKQVQLKYFKPDVVIVDYADILKQVYSKGRQNQYHAVGDTYTGLRALAVQNQVAVWTASQTNRGAVKQEIIDEDDIADSYKKIFVADFVMSLSRSIQDNATYTGRTFIVKNRLGPAKIPPLPTYVDLVNGIIQIYDSQSQVGKKLNQKMGNGKKKPSLKLTNKFKQFKQNNQKIKQT